MLVRSSRVVLPDGVRAASIHIENGRIVRVGAFDDEAWSAKLLAERHEFGDLVISPGIVDTHVHVNEPGRTNWEGFDTATRAAAAGGVTTIVDMPLNSVPATTDVAALEAKRAAARGRCHVDVGFWGGVVPGNAGELDALVDAGVRGFKCFLVPSGVDEFPHVGEAELRKAMPTLSRRRVPLLVHAESPLVIADCGLRTADSLRIQSTINPQSVPRQARDALSWSKGAILNPQYATYLASRPPKAEVEAVQLMIRLARECDTRVHIVHVACAEAVDEIARAKAEGVRITAETCPHYLTFAAEEIPDGATEFKCAPPVREVRHREALWRALQSGALDLVATDHSPAPPAMKCPGDFMRAWGGIASLELSLTAVWSRLHQRHSEFRTRNSEFVTLARWMSEAPAALAALANRKGRIAAGFDADLVVWDPDAERTVDPSRLQQRHKLTPYAGRLLRGVIRSTFVRGQRVWDGSELTMAAAGQLL